MKSNRKVNMIEGDGFPIRTISSNRNDLCQCGSEKKQKNCCGTKLETNYTNPDAKKKRQNYTINRAKSLIIGRWYTIRRMKYELGMFIVKLKKYLSK